MDDKLKFTIIIIQAVIIGILLIFLVFSLNDNRRVRELEEEVAGHKGWIDKCINRNDSLAIQIQQLKIAHSIPPFLDSNQLEYLRDLGLENPVEDIRNDLIENHELISRPGVLGGKMGFYFRDGIHLLNHRWAFAYFEDGHIEGAILLRFGIGDQGQIKWEVLDETPVSLWQSK